MSDHLLRSKFCGATTVGERGQIVIPAEARKEYGLEIGDKVMVFMSQADQVTRMLSDTIDRLGRIVKESKEPEGSV